MVVHNSKKKLAVVGRGTAGCLSFLHYWHFNNDEHDVEIDWIYDSNIPTTPVGEGTDMRIPVQLDVKAGFNTDNLLKIGGTPKLGIRKEGWGGSGSFLNPFPLGQNGIHMDAGELQKWIFKNFGNKVNLIDTHVDSADDVDADYVMMATGTPKNLDSDEFHKTQYIPVNAAYVTQCQWEDNTPTFLYTLAIARPWGWVFGIPLQHRCSIGYIFNKDISDVETIKEDVKEVFEKYNLTPTEKTNTIFFRNYYRKNPIDSRVSHNGNSCFFLEPLEATSLSSAYHIDTLTWKHWFGGDDKDYVNWEFRENMSQIEAIICMHYMSGSVYDTPFWSMAKEKGQEKIEEMYKNDLYKRWLKNVIQSKDNESQYDQFGTWDRIIWNINARELGVSSKMLSMQ